MIHSQIIDPAVLTGCTASSDSCAIAGILNWVLCNAAITPHGRGSYRYDPWDRIRVIKYIYIYI